MASVTIRNAYKSYGSVKVLHGIDVEIVDGEFIVLVGPSGCGKSTLLRMIAGLEEIDAGDIAIGDRVVNDVAPKDRDIAMVFQSYALYPHMNVSSNMSFSMELRRAAKQMIEDAVFRAAGTLGLDELLERLPRQLSGGQRQRVAMGRAIVRQPKVFLFDEPLSNLDAKLRLQMRTEIKSLHHELKTTAIYVTHDQVEAMTLADRIVIMHGGEIQQIGPPLEVYDHPANLFVAGFIGSPGMNFIEGTLQRDGARAWVGTQGGAELAVDPDCAAEAGQPVVYGIRPEAINIDLDPGNGVPATVDVVEPTGLSTLIYADVDGVSTCAYTMDRLTFDHGQTVGLVPDRNKAHLFDASTGVRL